MIPWTALLSPRPPLPNTHTYTYTHTIPLATAAQPRCCDATPANVARVRLASPATATNNWEGRVGDAHVVMKGEEIRREHDVINTQHPHTHTHATCTHTPTHTRTHTHAHTHTHLHTPALASAAFRFHQCAGAAAVFLPRISRGCLPIAAAVTTARVAATGTARGRSEGRESEEVQRGA